jgi:hypothetical protein
MQRPKVGHVYLVSDDSDIWSKPDMLDMIGLKAPSAEDLFTSWISETAVHWFHRVLIIIKNITKTICCGLIGNRWFGRFWRVSDNA